MQPGKERWLPKLAAVLALTTACHAAVGANDEAMSLLSFSAFGTLSMVHSSEELADFTNSGLKETGAGYTDAWSPNVDTTLGAQVVLSVTPQLSATLQVVSEQNYDKTYTPHVEWANIKYQFTPELSVRVGRTLLASFLFSDSRKVGYANPWVRPPVEAYSLVPVSTSDGLDVTWKVEVGRFSHTLIALAGQIDSRLPARLDGGAVEARDVLLLTDIVEFGPATLHFTYQESDTTLPSVNVLFDAMRNFGPQGIALADKYDLRHKTVRFIGVGAMYDPGKWFAIGEWGNTEFHSAVGNRTAWYLSGGYRVAKFTPYVTFGEAISSTKRFDPGLDQSQLPPQLAGFAAALNAGLNELLLTAPRQKSISVGARWDVLTHASLKL
ncbi:MAG: hypothetical protein ABI859_16110, partial [Pseudomonadota bacterium]